MKKDFPIKASSTDQVFSVEVADPVLTTSLTGGTPIPPVTPPVPTDPTILSIPAAAINEHPGSGFEQWHDQNAVPGLSGAGDIYVRRCMSSYYSGNSRTLVIPKEEMDLWAEAKRRNAHLSHGTFILYPDGRGQRGQIQYDGGYMGHPQWLHDDMKKEPLKPWLHNGYYMPNWNSPVLLSAIEKHNKDHYAAIVAAGYQDQIGQVDARFYGSWGEWHLGSFINNFSELPAGYKLTGPSGIRIIAAVANGFPNSQIQVLLNTMDENDLDNTKGDPAIKAFALSGRNNRGLFGIRWDSFLWTSAVNSFVDYYFAKAGSRYLSAPITGEPPSGPENSSNYTSAGVQYILKYHVNSIGNGNFDYGIPMNGKYRAIEADLRAVSNQMGYRLSVTGGSISLVGNLAKLVVNIKNAGLVPMYDDWKLAVETDKGTVITAATPRLVMNSATLLADVPLPAGWTKIKLKFVCPGRPDLLNLVIK